MRRLPRWRHSEESGGGRSAMDGKKYNEFYREARYHLCCSGTIVICYSIGKRLYHLLPTTLCV